MGSTDVSPTLENNGARNNRERARRFSVQMPIRYRVNGESRWWKGQTENVSCSGVLFRSELTVAPNTPIEMSMALPGVISENGGGELICRGTIVRVVTAPTAESLPALAATISHYRLVRP
jgi:hypothetical protein